MKICRSRWLPLLLALAVLATLIPVGAFVFAADTVEPPEGYVAISDRQVTHTINDNSSNEAVYEGAGPVADAPAGSKFAFYFDTTAVAYDTTKGDKNNWAVHFNVWSNSANAWVAMKANGKYVYSRRYIRDGKLIEDVRTAGADPDDGWIGSIPVGAKGYMILDTGDITLGDITAFKLSPEWGWNENLYNKNVILGGCGYIPPETPVVPPEGYVAISDRQVTHTINDNSSNEAVYEGAGPVADAPAGSKFAFYFDTTAVAYDTTKGDKNNWGVYIRVWSNSQNDWVDLKSGGSYSYTRRYIRDGKLIEDTRVEGTDPGTWIASVPVNAKGYMILDTGDISLGDITAFKLSPEWNWNKNLYNKNVILGGCGYIPPETPVEPPESSDPESSEPESSEPESSEPESSEPESIMDPPEGFVLVDKNGIDHEVNTVPDGGNRNPAYFQNFSAADAPAGSKLVFYFDTTAVPLDSSLGDKNNWAVYIDVLPADAEDDSDGSWQTLAFPADGSAITRIIRRNGQTTTVEGRDGDPSFLFAVPTEATGYMIVGTGQIDLNSIRAVRLRPEWNWNPNLYGKTLKFRNIGYIPGDGQKPEPPESSGPDTPIVNPDDFPFVPEPEGTPGYYGKNYVVTNPNLQELVIDGDMKNDLFIDLSSNRNAPAEAKAIVFRYNTTGIPETRTDYTDRGTHAAYWSMMVGDTPISGNIAGATDETKYVKHNQVYYWRGEVMENSGFKTWINTLPLNAIGYVVISIEDLQSYAQKFIQKGVALSEVTGILMKQEWFWNPDMFNQTIRITDVGYVMDPAAFIAAYKDSYVPDYLKGPLADGGRITVKADNTEGTFAELSWNRYEGAKRYFVNVYDEKGGYLLTERTRKTAMTLEGLKADTAYKVQILAVGEDDVPLSPSNVLDIRTLAEDIEPYRKGLLEYDPSVTVRDVKLSKDTATIIWDWIDGVEYYALHLYEKDGDRLTFVSRTLAKDGEGSLTLSGLIKGRAYVAQLVSYDVTDSIIYAYAPTDAFTPKNGADADNPDTGVGTAAAPLMLAALLSLGALAVIRKRRA